MKREIFIAKSSENSKSVKMYITNDAIILSDNFKNYMDTSISVYGSNRFYSYSTPGVLV